MATTLLVNKKLLNTKLKCAQELTEQAKLNNEKMLNEEIDARNKLKEQTFRPMTSKELRKQELNKMLIEKTQFLKEFVAETVYRAVPIDNYAKAPLHEEIKQRVFDYFDDKAATTMAKSLAYLSNPSAKFNMVDLGATRIDEKLIRMFDEKRVAEDTINNNLGDSGRVSVQDFLNFSTMQENAKLKKDTNNTISSLCEKVASVIKSKVVMAMKEEAEISQATNYLNEGVAQDPNFKLLNKQIARQSEKNTVFREVYRNVKLFNEFVTEENADKFMAEALLEYTILETVNSLFLEEMTPTERINSLVEDRKEYYRSKRT